MTLTVKTTGKSSGTSATTQRNEYHARYSIYNRANSGMQSRNSLRNSPEMHCKISATLSRAKVLSSLSNQHSVILSSMLLGVELELRMRSGSRFRSTIMREVKTFTENSKRLPDVTRLPFSVFRFRVHTEKTGSE